MKSLLYSELMRKKVDTPTKKGKAKLVEILALRKKGYWYAGEVMIESGLVDKSGKFFSVSDIEYDREEKRVKLSKNLNEGRTRPLDEHEFYLSRLDGRKVESHSGEELGRVYDFELYVDMKPWRVWKMMINPSGISPLKRRQRIPTKVVEELKSNKIILKKKCE